MAASPQALELPGLGDHSGTPVRVDLAAGVDNLSDLEDDRCVGLAFEVEEHYLCSPDSPAVAVSAFFHHLEDGDHLWNLVFADISGRTVDRGSRSYLGDRWHSSRFADCNRSAAENRALVYNLVAEVAGQDSLGRTAHSRSHYPRRGRRSIGHLVGSRRIHSPHILHVAAVDAHNSGREIGRSCRIVVEVDSQGCVIAPEPAGADRSMPAEERGIGELDYRPCCQSNGRRRDCVKEVGLAEWLHSSVVERSKSEDRSATERVKTSLEVSGATVSVSQLFGGGQAQVLHKFRVWSEVGGRATRRFSKDNEGR